MELILPLATCHCTFHCVILLFIILANQFFLCTTTTTTGPIRHWAQADSARFQTTAATSIDRSVAEFGTSIDGPQASRD